MLPLKAQSVVNLWGESQSLGFAPFFCQLREKMMPETPDDPYALYEAYHHAEKLLDAGTAEQSVIFTLMGRGMSHDQAVEIVNDLAGARVKRPQRFRTKADVA